MKYTDFTPKYIAPACRVRPVALEKNMCSPILPPIGGGEGGGEEPIGDDLPSE